MHPVFSVCGTTFLKLEETRSPKVLLAVRHASVVLRFIFRWQESNIAYTNIVSELVKVD
jgi:hypothetical protein